MRRADARRTQPNAAADLGEGEKGKMPRKGVEGLEILRGCVQKWRKTHIFGQKKIVIDKRERSRV